MYNSKDVIDLPNGTRRLAHLYMAANPTLVNSTVQLAAVYMCAERLVPSEVSQIY